MDIGIGLTTRYGNINDKVADFKAKMLAIGAVVNDDAIEIYKSLHRTLKTEAVMTLLPMAYKGNTVYGFDKDGNLVLFNHSRNSHATYYDKTGRLNYAAHNLVKASEDFTNASWILANTTTLQSKLIETNVNGEHYAYTAVASGNLRLGYVSFSVEIKSEERSACALSMYNGTAVNPYLYVNLTNGAFNVVAGNAQWLDATGSVVDIGDGWYRCTISANRTGGSQCNGVISIMATYGTTLSYTGVSNSGILVRKAQIRNHPSSPLYVATSGTEVYCPRLDYNPSTLTYSGLIIERSATNLVLKSDPSNSEGLNTNVAYASYTWPTGMLSNSVLYGNNSVNRYHTAGTVAPLTAYVFSCYLLMDDNSIPVIGSTNSTGDFNIFIGDIVTTNNGIISCGNNIYRVYGTLITLSSISFPGNNGIIKRTTQSTKGFKISGLQLEVGSYPTSYIPTNGNTSTRVVDTFTSNTDILLINDASIYMQLGYRPSGTAQGEVIKRSGGTGLIWAHPSNLPGNMSLFAYDGTNVANTTTNTTIGVIAKGITTYGSVGLKACINNSVVASTSFDGSMGNGNLIIGGVQIDSCFIQTVVIVPRQLSTIEMQQVTA